jgi:hypothetical protein
MMPNADNRVKWIKSDGTLMAHGAELAAGTYYAEIRKGRACAFGASLVYDGDIEATATIDGADTPSLVGESFDPTGVSGWISYATELGTKTITGTEGASGWQVADFEHGRARVALVVTVAGVCTLYATVGGN